MAGITTKTINDLRGRPEISCESFLKYDCFLLDMFIQHTAFLLNKGSQDRRRDILPPAVSNYCYGLLVLVYDVLITV